jgi:hypothetical protein
MTSNEKTYPVGTPGKQWGEAEKTDWLALQNVKRSYAEEVLEKLDPLKERFDVERYGSLSYAPDQYPVFIVKSHRWGSSLPVVLVTGGVHGYETSGVQGAIRFLETRAQQFTGTFNIMVAPCVSPWGYETINRWNPNAVDPNRSFHADSSSEEAAALMRYLDSFNARITMHIDLHETTDTDNSEFRPALAARDAIPQDNWNIPDGFYLVGDTAKPVEGFQKAIIESVQAVTHIAPPDDNGRIIGKKIEQWGVINYAARPLGLCTGMTDGEYVTTTEVYPDSPEVDGENCIEAQVAAVVGGLDYVANELTQVKG